MEVNEAEVSKKLRSTIREKLESIDCLTDPALPDYVLVLVANKKSKEQVEECLSLFLGKHTYSFCEWLQQLLKKSIKLSSVDGLQQKEGKSEQIKQTDVDSRTNQSIESEDDILALDPEENDTEDPLDKELEEQTIEKPVNNDTCDTNKVSEKQRSEITPSPKKPLLDSRVKSLKRKLEISVQDEYDPLYPSVRSVANSVVIKERKSSIPLALQANKILLMKAVDAANKSIVGKQNIGEVYKPTPIKVLTSNKGKDRFPKENQLSNLTSPINYDNNEYLHPFVDTASSDKHTIYTTEEEYNLSQPNLISVQMDPTYYGPSREVVITNYSEHSPVDTDMIEINQNPDETLNPQFIVTLDGVNSSIFRDNLQNVKNSQNIKNSQSIVNENTDHSADISDENVNGIKKPKLPERCRFWPACKNGNECIYHHPTVACKTFPKCKYGDKCLYIHPNCKFDSLCSRKDCPFTHSTKRDLINVRYVPVKPPKMVPTTPPSYMLPCKFYPNCSSVDCPFLHPKNCKFGSECHAAYCPYVHPNFPSRSQLKWSARASL